MLVRLVQEEGTLSDAGEFTVFTESDVREAGAFKKDLSPIFADTVRDVDAY